MQKRPAAHCHDRPEPSRLQRDFVQQVIPNDAASREARVASFGNFAFVDKDRVALRRWMRMISEATCEGIVSASIRSSTVRFALTFSCNIFRMNGTFRSILILILIASEEETIGAEEHGRKT